MKKDAAPAKAAGKLTARTTKKLEAKEEPKAAPKRAVQLIDDESEEVEAVRRKATSDRLSISDLQPMLNGMQLNSPAPAPRPVRTWDDIDAVDQDDPQAVTDYVEDIFKHLKQKERVDRANPSYMRSQTDITDKMRKVVIAWLVEVHLRFGVSTDTFFLAINVMDRFLSLRLCPRNKLQLIAITSLMIACKFEEIDQPVIGDFVYICSDSFKQKEILKSEEVILQALQYNLCNPTALHFLRRYSKAGQSDAKTHALAKYITELSLLEYGMLKYLPSEIAAASVYLARKWTGKEPWTSTLEHYTEFKELQITACITDLLTCVNNYGNATNPYSAVFKKYSSAKLGEVARIPPVKPN